MIFTLPPPLEIAIFLTSHLVLLSLFIQTLELLRNKSSWADDGIWRLKTLRKELDDTLPLVSFLLGVRVFKFILYLRVAIILVSIFFPTLAGFLYLLLSQVLICVRWRGTYNGGSDMMSLVTLLGLSMIWSAPEYSSLRMLGLFFIAAHTTFSYFLAGVFKLKQKSWRDGSALKHFLQQGLYVETNKLAHSEFLQSKFKLLSWATILFECLFPLCFIHPAVCVAFLIGACVFHSMNAMLMGLNRFLWAWMAAWPSLIFCANYLAART